MALRSGYKGFKKLINGLKVLRPGVLGIDIGTGLAIGQDGKLNVTGVDVTVAGNPEEAATAGDLTKLQIGNDIFNVPDTTYSNATTSAAGLMSATDKEKLDGLEDVTGNPTGTAAAGDLTKLQIGSDIFNVPDTTYSNATTSEAGLMSADDKTKVDDLTVTTGDITFQTGIDVYTAGEKAYKKYGKVCVLNIDISGAEGTQSSWVQIGQAPSGFRPTNNVVNNINVLIGDKLGQGQIFQDGNIRVKGVTAAIASTDIVHLNGVYIV